MNFKQTELVQGYNRPSLVIGPLIATGFHPSEMTDLLVSDFDNVLDKLLGSE